MLNMAKMLQLQMWDFHHPLYQFPFLGPEILTKIEGRKLRMEALREMSVADIGKPQSKIYQNIIYYIIFLYRQLN
jgi:hypothetical protein